MNPERKFLMSDNYPFNNDENNKQNSSSFIYENNSSPKKPKKHTYIQNLDVS